MFVKSPVFPFVRFPGVDTILGPGDEVDRRGDGRRRQTSARAFAKAMLGAGQRLPEQGTVFISVNNDDKPTVLPIARDLAELGLHARRRRAAPRPTCARTASTCEVVFKVNEGRPNVADEIVNQQHRPGHQHAARPRVVLRRPGGAPRRDDGAGAVHHDAHRRLGGGRARSRRCDRRRSTCGRCRTTTRSRRAPSESRAPGASLARQGRRRVLQRPRLESHSGYSRPVDAATTLHRAPRRCSGGDAGRHRPGAPRGSSIPTKIVDDQFGRR